jgi:hypothetical protein
MKKILLLLLCVPLIGWGQGQVTCSLLDVTDVVIDNTNMTIDIEIYDGNTGGFSYPFVAFTIDAMGDTIQNGSINSFGTGGLDTSWYNYIIAIPINPIYPLSIYFVYNSFTNPGQDTCILSYHPSCDSVITSFTQIDSSSTPHLIHFDIQTFGLSNGNFGYGGFVLIDDFGDTIAFENINTAANVFGPMEYDTDSRMLDVIQNFTLPFSGTLHLITGWFAGNSSTSCIFPFNINNGTTDINEIINGRKLLKVTDFLGRTSKESQNIFLFYIYDDGTVEKKIIIE